MSKELMKRCAFCEEIKFGFAGFDIKMNEEDEGFGFVIRKSVLTDSFRANCWLTIGTVWR